MATVQVRELPEETYEVLRRRARRAGQSIQAYMRDQLISMAAQPTKEEALASIEDRLKRRTWPEPSIESILEDIDSGRTEI